MPVNSKRKGKIGELEVVKILEGKGFTARRSQQFKGSPTSPDLISNFPFEIEVKFKEQLNIHKAVDKIKKESGKEFSCVIHRKKRTSWLFTTTLEDFLDFLASKE